MKIDSEKTAKSMEFYRNYDSKRHIRDYALMLAFENKLNLRYEEVIEWFKGDYLKYMKNHFNFGILFADEVYQFAFDESGNLLPLDNIIFQKLRLYAAKCRVLDYEERIRLLDSGFLNFPL